MTVCTWHRVEASAPAIHRGLLAAATQAWEEQGVGRSILMLPDTPTVRLRTPAESHRAVSTWPPARPFHLGHRTHSHNCPMTQHLGQMPGWGTRVKPNTGQGGARRLAVGRPRGPAGTPRAAARGTCSPSGGKGRRGKAELAGWG